MCMVRAQSHAIGICIQLRLQRSGCFCYIGNILFAFAPASFCQVHIGWIKGEISWLPPQQRVEEPQPLHDSSHSSCLPSQVLLVPIVTSTSTISKFVFASTSFDSASDGCKGGFVPFRFSSRRSANLLRSASTIYCSSNITCSTTVVQDNIR